MVFSKYHYGGYGDIANDASAASGTYGSGDIIMMAFDLDNNKLLLKMDTWHNSTNPIRFNNMTIDSTINYIKWFLSSNNVLILAVLVMAFDVNFGNGFFGTTAISSEGTNASGIGKFEYDVPTGYTALSTKGLNE